MERTSARNKFWIIINILGSNIKAVEKAKVIKNTKVRRIHLYCRTDFTCQVFYG